MMWCCSSGEVVEQLPFGLAPNGPGRAGSDLALNDGLLCRSPAPAGLRPGRLGSGIEGRPGCSRERWTGSGLVLQPQITFNSFSWCS